MGRVSLYLSSMLWSKEDEIRVWKYSASPGFPHRLPELGALVARLGLDESEEDRRKQFHGLVCGVLEALRIPNAFTMSAFLEAIGSAAPSDYSTKVFAILIQTAKDMVFDIGEDCNRLIHGDLDLDESASLMHRMQDLFHLLESLLKNQLAEGFVQATVPLGSIPNALTYKNHRETHQCAELVLLMFKEVVSGRLLLKAPLRMALLTHWHKLLKSSLKAGTFERVTADLFQTLPLKQKAELLQSESERVSDFISIDSLSTSVL